MTFRVGQKVVCVDASNCTALEQGGIYTVLATCARSGDPSMMEVDCCPSCTGSRGYLKIRFRPIVSRKTDISVFTRMLTDTSVDA